MLRRLRGENGFGLIELLVALMMLNIGIMAIIASFSAGSAAILRASRNATASTLADQQMELYRALTYSAIALDSSTIPSSAPYTTDSAYSASQITATCSGSVSQHNECNASRTVTGPDHGSYRVDAYISWTCASGTLGGTVTAPTCSGTNASRPAKLVTVVVRDGTNLTGQALVREGSSFDQSTGS